jgi:5,10-methylenetetrahydromethanopterin reductase
MPEGLRVGIAFQGDKRPADYAALARLVDGYGFDVVSVYNDLLYQPALGPLLWMAPHLSRATLGPAALNPYTVHPLEIAGQAALLDLATEGRAYLGLTRGAWLDALGVDQPRPIATLREAMQLVRHLLAGRREPFQGEVFQLVADAALRYAPVRPAVPITLGTWGLRTARVAGALADEVKVGGSTNPALVGHLRPALDAGSAEAGRPSGSVGVCLGAVSVVDEDRAAARALARREVALYLPVVARLDPTCDDPAWLARIQAAARRGAYEEVAADISDDMLDRFAFAGAPSDLIEHAERIAAAGATRIEFGTPHGLDSVDGIRLLGERVLPEIARLEVATS